MHLGQTIPPPAATPGPRYSRNDFNHSPMLVFYELTRACNLKCLHCRADAQRNCHPEELTPSQSLDLISQLKTFPRPPLLVLTGGDPMKRRDVFSIIAHARREGLEVAMTPSATPLVTTQAINQLAASGLHRLALSIDGADAHIHDAFRGVPGSFDRTLRILADATRAQLPIQVNTTLHRGNIHQLEAMGDLMESLSIVLWSVFFLIPTGRGLANQRLNAPTVEWAFEVLYEQMAKRRFAIKTTEAPHFRRFVMQRRGVLPAAGLAAVEGLRLIGTNDGKGVLFVSHIGEIMPAGFLPLVCGRFPQNSILDNYQSHPTFTDLRDATKLKGKCGECEYKEICGGSRARAFALTHDPLAAEPDCMYTPESMRGPNAAVFH